MLYFLKIRRTSHSAALVIINKHIDLIVLKKGTGAIPIEEAYYFHNGKVKTTTGIIKQITKDFKRFGKSFLEKRAREFEKSDLLKVGFDFIDHLKIDKSGFKEELESDLLISRFKNETYTKLKKELQKVKGVDKGTRKKIPKLTYELLEFYCDAE